MSKVSLPAPQTVIPRATSPYLVVGFSARALAAATAQLGHPPVVADCYADHDCRQVAAYCLPLAAWRQALDNSGRQMLQAMLAAASPADTPRPQVLLGGGTENWPSLLDELHAHFQVLGPTSMQLRSLRSRACWQHWAAQAAIGFPSTVAAGQLATNLDAQPGWLSKPAHAAGGHGIRRLAANTTDGSQGRYWQQEITGRSLGAHCILFENHSQLLGVTESFGAHDWPAPSEFIYRGSWGPVPLTSPQVDRVLALAEQIRRATQLRGWLQMDLIEDTAGKLWLLELNPRWTAGMEVLVHTGNNPVAAHLAAWQSSQPAGPEAQASKLPPQATHHFTGEPQPVFAKAVVYAEQDIELTRERLAQLHAWPVDQIADIPAAEQLSHRIASGHPLLTVTAQTASLPTPDTRAELLRQLHHCRSDVFRCLR